MVVLEACNNFVIPFFVFKHSLLKSFVPGRVLKFWCVYPLSLSLLLRCVSSCKCLDLKFGSLVYHSKNWGCCRSNMLCPQEESVLLLGGFLAAFLANPWEGLHWTSEEEALGCTLKVLGNLILLSHILVSLAMHFSTDLAFSSRWAELSLCGPCFICKS